VWIPASFALVALLTFLVSGCSVQALLDAASRSPEARFARDTAAFVLQKDTSALLQRMPHEIRERATPAELEKLYAEVPPGLPGEPTLVGYNYFSSPSGKQTLVSFQYPFPNQYVLVQVGLASTEAQPTLYYIHIERLPDALERLNAFVLRGKSLKHYIFLSLAIATTTFTLIVLVLCARTRLPRRKWLWMILVALGCGQFTINWTTGDIATRLVSVQLMGSGAAAAGPYAPWLVSFSLPVGAFLFIYRRRQLGTERVLTPGQGLTAVLEEPPGTAPGGEISPEHR
jgi:hypothetical protein